MDLLLQAFGAIDLADEHQLDLLEKEFATLGAHYMNRAGTNIETSQFRSRYVAKYGNPPRVVARAWQLLETEQSPLPEGLMKKHLLWGLNLIKEYNTVRSFASNLDGIDEKTATKWSLCALVELSNLCSSVIVWENRNRGEPKNDRRAGLDGLHCYFKQQKIWDPAKQKKVMNKSLNSWKLKGPGLAYQVVHALNSSDIVHISGPYLPGDVNDLQMFFQSGLVDMLEDNERLEGDQGYIGADPEYIVTPEGVGPGRYTESRKKEKKRIDARIETVNSCWKSYDSMSTKPFRHSAEQHQTFFFAIGAMSQIAIEMGELIIYQAYKDED